MLRLFVYGTLKSGQARHHLLAAQARTEPAQVCGQLYHLPAGYPMLVVPPQSVLATGTSDPHADLVVQNQFATRVENRQGLAEPFRDEWDAIEGEVIALSEASLLKAIDRYEGFAPGEPSLYVRVLVPTWGHSTAPAWTYVTTNGLPQRARRIGNSWPER